MTDKPLVLKIAIKNFNMHSITQFLIAVASFSALVAGNACVTGGPETAVKRSHACCYAVSGKWFQNYPNQGICVMEEDLQDQYDDCVAAKNQAVTYDFTCIVCDASTDCGLD